MSEPEGKTAAVAEPAIPEKGITVELAYATIPAFQTALQVARKHPTCQEVGEGKSLRVRVTYQLDELDALQALKDTSWELRHRRAWLDGAEIAWDEMCQLSYCFREFVRSPKRDHCFFDGNFWSGFGCRYAIANLADRINNDWLGFGHKEPGGVWVFDKKRIAEHVKKHVYRGFHHCPAFDQDYLELFLELFPERVDPAEDDRWQLLRNRQGEIIGAGPAGAEAAKKIIYELQAKIVERRGADKVQPNGKRKLAPEILKPYRPPPKKKKGLLARLFGEGVGL